MIRDGIRQRFASLAMAASILLAGCAASPQVGVRDAYRDVRIESIAVAPVYATSEMGLEPDRLDEVNAMVETGAVEALRTYGYDVTTPDQLRQQLEREELLQAWRDGVLLRGSLPDYFEAGENPSSEVTTLRRLYEADALPSRYVLFGELVYHTTTRCRVDPRKFHPLAAIEGPPAESTPRGQPCVVTHVRFKLVDAKTADTMWFNEVLFETRDADSVDELIQPNVYGAVDRAIAGDHGLTTSDGDS